MIINKQAKRQAKQLLRSCLINGLLDEDRARQAVRNTLISSYRDGGPTLTHFLRLVRLHRAQHTAVIESAAPLPLDIQALLHDRLARLYGPGLAAAFAQRPSLLGGVRIQVGSDVYDGSVRGRLAALENTL
jgi:F-type H+-transporting ATPase subunit delta